MVVLTYNCKAFMLQKTLNWSNNIGNIVMALIKQLVWQCYFNSKQTAANMYRPVHAGWNLRAICKCRPLTVACDDSTVVIPYFNRTYS